VTEPAPVGVADDDLTAGSALRLHPLSVTRQGDGVVVGRPDVGRFVALPEVGARTLELLGSGLSVAAVERQVTPAGADEPVDVLGFARALVALGLVAEVVAGGAQVRADEDAHATGRPDGPGADVRPPGAPRQVAEPPTGRRLPPAWARALVSRPVAVLATLCAVASVVLVVSVPAVRPDPLDVFFLATPAQSLAVLTLVTCVLAAAHEGAHVLAAASLGVPARLRVTRRLYFLTFETNLTGLWALEPRRRVGPLLAGMVFDAVVLCTVLVLRATGTGPDAFLAALAVVEVSALVTQLFVFLRTDVYAVMTALLGCTVLARTTRLLLLRSVRRLSPADEALLAATPARDLAVARWYRVVHVAGLALAAWFFVAFFVPSTWHLLTWMHDALTAAGPGTGAFWQALVLGVLLLSPRLVTGVVAVRDLVGRHGRHGGHRGR
jgi:hypothetical protein